MSALQILTSLILYLIIWRVVKVQCLKLILTFQMFIKLAKLILDPEKYGLKQMLLEDLLLI